MLLVLILDITRYMEIRKCQAMSKVTPFTYTDSGGNTIVYYCIQTAYLENESGDYTEMDMSAISLVVGTELIENKRECKVNEYNAFMCELGNRSYLCWTLSPELSCVIEYSAEAISEETYSGWRRVFRCHNEKSRGSSCLIRKTAGIKAI